MTRRRVRIISAREMELRGRAFRLSRKDGHDEVEWVEQAFLRRANSASQRSEVGMKLASAELAPGSKSGDKEGRARCGGLRMSD